MDEKAFLLQEIRYSKRKQNVKSSCAMKAQELPQVEPSPWCWKDVRCLSLLYGACVGCFGSFMWCGSWRHLYGNEEMYHGTGSTADRPFRVSGTDRDGIWAYRKRGQYRPDAAQRCRAYVTGRPCMEKRRVFVRTEGNLWHFFFPLGWLLFFRLCRPPRINR